MKVAGGVLACVLAAWLQVSFFGHFRPLGVMPNVMLVVVVLFGVWTNATPALAAAIGGGFLLDLVSGTDFGLHMAFYVVVALTIVALRQLGVRADSVVSAAAAVIAAAVLYNLVVLGALGAPFSLLAASRIGRELADDLILLLLIYLIRVNLGPRPRAALDLSRELPR